MDKKLIKYNSLLNLLHYHELLPSFLIGSAGEKVYHLRQFYLYSNSNNLHHEPKDVQGRTKLADLRIDIYFDESQLVLKIKRNFEKNVQGAKIIDAQV